MVKKRGEKRSQPENDPHHTMLHIVHNNNSTKGHHTKNDSKHSDHINKKDISTTKCITGYVNQSFRVIPKQLGIIALPPPKTKLISKVPIAPLD
jgi:hypothetical protein